MTGIGKIIRIKSKNVKYGKGLYDLLTVAMKNPQPEENILTQTEVSMKSNMKDGEVNYYSNRITMVMLTTPMA